MRIHIASLFFLFAIDGFHVAWANSLELFTRIERRDQTPPADALTVYDSEIDVRGIAWMPDEVAVRIPRDREDVNVVITRERMDRREGFTERDPVGCNSDKPPPGACEIIPYPELPLEQFSYSWVGRSDLYDLRLTIHRGHAIGILVGPAGRFAVSWRNTKALRLEYFNVDDELETRDRPAAEPASPREVPVMSAAAARAATLATIAPRDLGPDGSSHSQLDIAFLFTEEARREAGGNPADCRDTLGLMTAIHARVDQMNEAFLRSEIPAQIGVVSVSRLYGYTLIPHDGDNNNTRTNLNARWIQL